MQIKPFENFLNYFNRQGLDINEIDISIILLKKIYNETNEIWRPCECRTLCLVTEIANKILNNFEANNFFGEIKNKKFGYIHFYWVSKTKKRDFIIDPTGIPEYNQYGKEVIIPYFGLKDYAKDNHKKVYDKMEDLDSWGTREFPPGFHP